jgi:hypothetical protein
VIIPQPSCPRCVALLQYLERASREVQAAPACFCCCPKLSTHHATLFAGTPVTCTGNRYQQEKSRQPPAISEAAICKQQSRPWVQTQHIMLHLALSLALLKWLSLARGMPTAYSVGQAPFAAHCHMHSMHVFMLPWCGGSLHQVITIALAIHPDGQPWAHSRRKRKHHAAFGVEVPYTITYTQHKVVTLSGRPSLFTAVGGLAARSGSVLPALPALCARLLSAQPDKPQPDLKS